MQDSGHDGKVEESDANRTKDVNAATRKRSDGLSRRLSSSTLITETPGHTSSRDANTTSSGNGLLSPSGTLRVGNSATRPRLQTKASTALSLTDIYTQPEHERSPTSRPLGSREPSTVRTVSFAERLASRRNSDVAEDNASIRSFRSTRSLTFEQEHGDTVESLLGDTTARLGEGREHDSAAIDDGRDFLTDLAHEDAEFRELFGHEFDELEPLAGDGHNEGETRELFPSATPLTRMQNP